MLPFWVVAEILYGKLGAEMVADLKEMIPLRETLFRRMVGGGLTRFSVSRFLPTATNRDLATFQNKWKTFNDHAYAITSQSGAPTATPIVNMYDSILQGSVTLQNVLQTLDECLFANLDVTTGAMSWNIVFLAANENYQEMLLKEMEPHKVRGERKRKHVLSSGTLLAACVFESARLRPAAAFSVPQAAPTGRVVEGFVIPAGTDIIINSYSLNMERGFLGPRRRNLSPGALHRGRRPEATVPVLAFRLRAPPMSGEVFG
ncbi:cytochrome P450 [Xylariaceae sp. FL0594]|nr:cytochrome P450 [Xylariaceae sp. FL0594]